MKIKLFGKELFNFKMKSTGDKLWDFAQFGLLGNEGTAITMLSNYTVEMDAPGSKKKKTKKIAPKPSLTPKEILELGSLNDNKFEINIDPQYIKDQIRIATEKISLYPKQKKEKKDRYGGVIGGWEMGSVKYGREELLSIIERLDNRNVLHNYDKIIDKYPHTTSALVEQVLKDNSGIKCDKADNLIPDFPSDAVKAMKEYDKMCLDICGKKTNFYVIAKNEDFQKQNKRRDPILLAQSPFGFFWQILGAWDSEMIYLGDL